MNSRKRRHLDEKVKKYRIVGLRQEKTTYQEIFAVSKKKKKEKKENIKTSLSTVLRMVWNMK